MPTALNGLATEAQASDEGEIGASSFESGGKSSDSDTDFRVVLYTHVCVAQLITANTFS